MNTKQVIVMRKDLKMRKGKMVAQGAHASMAVFFNKFREFTWGLYKGIPRSIATGVSLDTNDPVIDWCANSFTKICVYVNSEEELLEVFEKAKQAELPCALIRDSGKTEFKEPTYTCCAIGPWYGEKIDHITKGLKLL